MARIGEWFRRIEYLLNRGRLEADRLPSAGWQNGERVLTHKDGAKHAGLGWPKIRVPEVVMEQAARGSLTITSLAEESLPPASSGDDTH